MVSSKSKSLISQILRTVANPSSASTAIASTGGLLLFRIAKSQGDFLGRVVVYDTDKLSTDTREVYLPLDHADGSNPSVPVEEPSPGVFIYRPRQSPLYASIGSYTDELVWYIQQKTKRTNAQLYPSLGERPWNVSSLVLLLFS